MKLEQSEMPLLFSETIIPDIFFAEYLSQMPSNSVKIYLYMIFLSKYKKDIKLNDLSKQLNNIDTKNLTPKNPRNSRILNYLCHCPA